MEIIQPPDWPRPRGYSNGISAQGRMVFVAGQIGWNSECVFETDLFWKQTRQAFFNTVEVLSAAEAKPEHIVRMTIGKHYPAMSVLVVSELIEEAAKVEIETTAVIPEVSR
jgi:enamine deaminase RidA (YjgF/YER057c/UK114 family)